MGFGLLEVLIALMITMIALDALLTGGINGVRISATAARYEHAASLARSYLALASLRPVPGEVSGDAGGGYRWLAMTHALSQQRLVPPGAPPGAAAGAPLVTLYAITVRVSWQGGGGGTEQIETRRLTTSYPGT